MNKEIGKVYNSGRTWILCTGSGRSDKVFSGVVVRQDDETSDHQVGNYSNTWTDGVFKESHETVTIDNSTWRERFEIGESSGH
jgi:hypothetical protein